MPSESSEKMYESQITTYFKKSKFSPDDDFLRKNKEVIAEIKDLYQNKNTQKNMLNAIIIYGRKIDYPEKWLAYYGVEIDRLNQDLKAAINTNEKTDKQAENWITMEELKKAVDSLRNGIPTQISTYSQYRSLMAFLAVFLQSEFPRRNDYATMKLVIQEPTDKEHNYMVMPYNFSSKSKFIFNKYKTVAKFGQQSFPIGEKIYYVLRHFKTQILNFSKDGYLFIRRDGQPMNTNEYTKFFIATMHEKTGKKIGTSLMRHMIISDKFAMDKDELARRQQMANEMGHSIGQQMQYAKS